jgi:3-dehydroquinate synthase
MTAEDFNLLMYRDKKVLDGELRLVLLRTLGDAEVTSEYSAQSLQTVLSSNFS